MRRFVLAAVIVLLTPVAAADSIAVKLTTLSLDKDVQESSPETERTRAALTRSATVCKDGEDRIANSAWHVTKLIREKGIHAESTDIIEGVNAALLGASEKQDCIELMSMYALSRIDGSTHSDAVTGARGLYRMMGVIE